MPAARLHPHRDHGGGRHHRPAGRGHRAATSWATWTRRASPKPARTSRPSRRRSPCSGSTTREVPDHRSGPAALLQQPTDPVHPQLAAGRLRQESEPDPWGNDYQYVYPGTHGAGVRPLLPRRGQPARRRRPRCRHRQLGCAVTSLPRARSGGFTLIELLVVVVIIADRHGNGRARVGTTGRDRELEKESERMLALLNYTREQAGAAHPRVRAAVRRRTATSSSASIRGSS